MTPQNSRCRATWRGDQCDYHGTREDIRDHAASVGHPQCCSCLQPLTEHEHQTCTRCVSRVRDNLDAIVAGFQRLEEIIGEAAYRGTAWAALTLTGDGSTTGGGVDDNIRYGDPAPVIAVLENHDLDWRETFDHPHPPHHPHGHPDRETPKQLLGNVVDYLTTWHMHAAREHPEFGDYAAELHDLRWTVEQHAGLVNHATRGVLCACEGATLTRRWTDSGLEDNWRCTACGTSLTAAEYAWRLMMLAHVPGWVSVESAARTVARPVKTVWDWVNRGEVGSACSRVTRRVLVDLAAVEERSAATGRVTRRSA